MGVGVGVVCGRRGAAGVLKGVAGAGVGDLAPSAHPGAAAVGLQHSTVGAVEGVEKLVGRVFEVVGEAPVRPESKKMVLHS